MPTAKKPTVTDERRITVDGKEYTLAELQALYDAIAEVPGIQQKVQTITVEKIVERDKANPYPYVQPLRPYWQDPDRIVRPDTISPMPSLPQIWCGQINESKPGDDGTLTINATTAFGARIAMLSAARSAVG